MTMIKRFSPRKLAATLPKIKIQKLSRSEFSRAIKRGQGRALLHVAEYGDKGMEKDIKASLLDGYASRYAAEEYRMLWTYSLLELSGRPKFYGEFLLRNFCGIEAKPADVEHQYRLAQMFFEIGMTEFRSRMASGLERVMGSFYMQSCGDSFLRVSGQAGLEYLAKLCGSQPDYIRGKVCHDLLESAIELGCETTIKERMEILSERVPEVKVFMELCEKYKRESARPRRARFKRIEIEDLSAIIQEGIQEEIEFKFILFGLGASPSELTKVEELLLESSTSEEQTAWLSVFWFKGVPEDSANLTKFLESKNARVQCAASRAFSKTESEVVRKIAVKLLKSSRKSQILSALSLLESNYKSEDAARINEVVQLLTREDDLHQANLSILTIVENASGIELAPSIGYLYENLLCANCRFELLKQLVDWDMCPFHYLWEAQWDVDLDTQNYARGIVASLEFEDWSGLAGDVVRKSAE